MPHSENTDLETRQIHDLCHATKTKIKTPKIKNIDHTINIMINEAYHNEHVNNIYNKKYIIMESLKELHKSEDHNKDYHRRQIIDMYDPVINGKINIEEFKKNKKRKSCSCL